MTPTYQAKPVRVEARRWDGSPQSTDDIITWTHRFLGHTATYQGGSDPIITIRRVNDITLTLRVGCYLVLSPKARFSVTSASNFSAQYDRVPEDTVDAPQNDDRASGGPVPHEDKEHPAEGRTWPQVATKNLQHDPADANCVKHVQGEPSKPVECPICTTPPITHRRARR